MTKKIPLTQGKFTVVDDADFEQLNRHKWFASRKGNTWYAVRVQAPSANHICMHRVIMNAPKGMEVDHQNNDGLDNRRGNLRICTHAENLRNVGKSTRNTSGFKGVSWDKRRQKYTAQISVSYKDIRLGRFTDPIEAAKAYDEAARKYYGEFARTNFSPTP